MFESWVSPFRIIMDIHDTRLFIFKRAHWHCEVCKTSLSKGVPQLAHIINQSKMYLNMYGPEIIHHPLNMKAVCGLICNSKVSINGKHNLVEILVDVIRGEIENEKKAALPFDT